MTWIVKDSQADFFARSSKIICKQPTWTNHNQAYVPGGSGPRDWRVVFVIFQDFPGGFSMISQWLDAHGQNY